MPRRPTHGPVTGSGTSHAHFNTRTRHLTKQLSITARTATDLIRTPQFCCYSSPFAFTFRFFLNFYYFLTLFLSSCNHDNQPLLASLSKETPLLFLSCFSHATDANGPASTFILNWLTPRISRNATDGSRISHSLHDYLTEDSQH